VAPQVPANSRKPASGWIARVRAVPIQMDVWTLACLSLAMARLGAGGTWLLLLLASLAQSAEAQTPRVRDTNGHSWWVYYGDHPVKKSKFGVLAEVQIRRTKFADAWQQLLLRGGTTYRVTPRVQLGGGYGFIRTGRYGGYPFDRAFNEHRIFEQATFRHDAGRLELEHRYRVEQRWLQAFAGGKSYWRYQDRFRYQLRGAVNVTKANAQGQQWYLFGGDELFLNFGPNYGASPFDQNRAYFGVGRKLSPSNRLEVSYLNQFLVQRTGLVEESNHTFRVQLTSVVGIFGR